MQEMRVPATMNYLDEVLEDVEKKLESIDCSPKIMSQFAIAIEEIFVNIVHYGYKDKKGEVLIYFHQEGNPKQVSLQFIDEGKPYNPLEKKDPDITLSIGDRAIGGLGIYLVKKLMDHVEYECKDNKNILTIMKYL